MVVAQGQAPATLLLESKEFGIRVASSFIFSNLQLSTLDQEA
jgi:hypothetical protein